MGEGRIGGEGLHRANGLSWSVALFVLLGAFLAPASAQACSCVEATTAELFELSSEVFIGRLAAVEEVDSELVMNFEPVVVYKPSPEPIGRYFTARGGAACGVEVKLGALYVVLVHRDPRNGDARLSYCSGTGVLYGGESKLLGLTYLPAHLKAVELNELAGRDILAQVAAHEPDPSDAKSEGLVGLLEIPALERGETIELFAAPSPNQEPLLPIAEMVCLAHRESSYEEAAAEVFALVGDWYKLRTADGAFAWLPASSAGRFWPLSELPVGRLAYLTPTWRGFVWSEPGVGAPFNVYSQPSGAARPKQSVLVLGSHRVGSTLWFRVRVLSASGCDSEVPRVLAIGWVPAYDTEGQPAVWFHSRGC